MKTAAFLAAAVALTACSTPLAQRAQRADGLFAFVADSPGEVARPKVTIVPGSVQISATARVEPDGLHVRGSVSPAGVWFPTVYSHLDVVVHDRSGRVIASRAVRYFPMPMRTKHPRGPMRSHLAERFAGLGATPWTVEISHHRALRSDCTLPHE